LRTATNLAAGPRVLPASHLGRSPPSLSRSPLPCSSWDSTCGREDQQHWIKISSGQELIEGFVIGASTCPGVFRDVLATLGVM